MGSSRKMGCFHSIRKLVFSGLWAQSAREWSRQAVRPLLDETAVDARGFVGGFDPTELSFALETGFDQAAARGAVFEGFLDGDPEVVRVFGIDE